VNFINRRREKMANNRMQIGENKLDKLVRLMKRYQDDINLMEGDVEVQIKSNGSGSIYAESELIYDFDVVDKMFEFLEAGELKRTLMVRG
jgi:hypothetical protein